MTDNTSQTAATPNARPSQTIILFCDEQFLAPAGKAGVAASALEHALRAHGVALIVQPVETQPGGPDAEDVRAMLAGIEATTPEAVVSRGPWQLALAALTAALKVGTRFVFLFGPELSQDGDAQDRIAMVAQGSDAVLLDDAAARQALIDSGVAPEKLHLTAQPAEQAAALLNVLGAR